MLLILWLVDRDVVFGRHRCYAINTASHQSGRTSSNRRGDISCFQESKKISDFRADGNRLRRNCVAIRHSRSRPADGRSSSPKKNWRPCCTACRRYCWLVAHAISAQGQQRNARVASLVGRLSGPTPPVASDSCTATLTGLHTC